MMVAYPEPCRCGCHQYRTWTEVTTGSRTSLFKTWQQAMKHAARMTAYAPKVHKQPFGNMWVVTLRKPYIYTATWNGTTA